MCSVRRKSLTGRYFWALAVMFGLLALTHSTVHAVQASGSIPLIQSDNTLEQDQVFTVIVRIANTSTETGAEGNAAVPATYLAGGAITVTLACQQAPCVGELPNTLQFVPAGLNGCVISVPEVTSCVASGDNAVIINIGSNLVIPAGGTVDVATIQLSAENPVLNPISGLFFQRGRTGANDLEARSLINPDLGPVTSGAEGSTAYLFPGRCDVQVDKQISCDGGVTWVDAGLVNDNEDGTNGCITANPNPILVRYQVSNSGDFTLADCTLDETNGAFGDPPIVVDLAVGDSTDFLPGELSPQCQAAVVNEPDTATVSCNICGGVPRLEPITATDTATFECQRVELRTDRAVDCGDGPVDQTLVTANDDGTIGCEAPNGEPINWTYQASNPGVAPLFDCVLVDQNPLVSPNPIQVGNLAPGQTLSDIPAGNLDVACSNALETSEVPNGGRVDLQCCTVNVADIAACPDAQRVTAFDVSTVMCLAPNLDVQKLCVDSNDDRIDEITITVRNTGEVNLVDCQATDSIFLDDPECPANVGSATPVTVAPAMFNVATGGTQLVLGEVGPLDAPACNTTSVRCTIEGTTQTITRTDDAVCPGEPPKEGCLTRTPGFWGNHPFLIESTDPRSLDLLPLEVCDTTLTNVNAGNGSSTTEAICSVGRDGKILGPQLTQLVRQCTAALLNVAASRALEGECLTDFPQLGNLLTGCCGDESVCTGDPVPGLSVGECIDRLDAFNNTDPDTLNFPFRTGRADPSICQDAKNNGVVVDPTP